MSKEIETLYARYNHVEEDLKRKTQESKNFEKLFESTNGAYSALKEQFYTQEKELQYFKSKYESLAKERDHYKNVAEEKSSLPHAPST